MTKNELQKDIMKRKKVELIWDEYEMNLYIIANYLELLGFCEIPKFENIQNRIQELINDIYFLLKINDEQGDIIRTHYILTYEK